MGYKLQVTSFKNRGFTITELLVVIAIIGILSAILIPNYRSFKKQLALQRSATKLAQDIRRAQGMAVAAEECEPPPSSCPIGGGVPKGGYGVFFSQSTPDSYILYADSGTTPGLYRYTVREEIETINLEKEVKIDSVSPTQISINFMPPDPTVELKDNLGGDYDEYVTIKLCIKETDCSDPKNIKKVIINKAGLIDVD